MPISLRLPPDVEAQITGFGARRGMSKSAVIVRSIQEFLARHAQPTSFQIYEDVMRGSGAERTHDQDSDDRYEAAEKRPEKIAVREQLRRKHLARSRRASKALAKRSTNPRNSARKSV